MIGYSDPRHSRNLSDIPNLTNDELLADLMRYYRRLVLTDMQNDHGIPNKDASDPDVASCIETRDELLQEANKRLKRKQYKDLLQVILTDSSQLTAHQARLWQGYTSLINDGQAQQLRENLRLYYEEIAGYW